MAGSAAPVLESVPGTFVVHRLPPAASLPGSVVALVAAPDSTAAGIAAIMRTPDEITVVCERSIEVPGARSETGWVAFRVVGTLDFGLTGILHSLTGPLADAGIPVFALSTFDTDYLLVRKGTPEESRAAAIAAWTGAAVPVADRPGV